jgi:hypothetical protein
MKYSGFCPSNAWKIVLLFIQPFATDITLDCELTSTVRCLVQFVTRLAPNRLLEEVVAARRRDFLHNLRGRGGCSGIL